MVEAVTRVKGNDRFCNYSFETITVQGANYRVPVLNKANMGKVIEKNFTEEENKNQQRSNARGGQKQ